MDDYKVATRHPGYGEKTHGFRPVAAESSSLDAEHFTPRRWTQEVPVAGHPEMAGRDAAGPVAESGTVNALPHLGIEEGETDLRLATGRLLLQGNVAAWTSHRSQETVIHLRPADLSRVIELGRAVYPELRGFQARRLAAGVYEARRFHGDPAELARIRDELLHLNQGPQGGAPAFRMTIAGRLFIWEPCDGRAHSRMDDSIRALNLIAAADWDRILERGNAYVVRLSYGKRWWPDDASARRHVEQLVRLILRRHGSVRTLILAALHHHQHGEPHFHLLLIGTDIRPWEAQAAFICNWRQAAGWDESLQGCRSGDRMIHVEQGREELFAAAYYACGRDRHAWRAPYTPRGGATAVQADDFAPLRPEGAAGNPPKEGNTGMKGRPQGASETLETRRRRAIELFELGHTSRQIAEEVGVDRRSVDRWISSYRQLGTAGIKARPNTGRPTILRGERLEELIRELDAGPAGLYPGHHYPRQSGWRSLDVVRLLSELRDRWGISFSPGHIDVPNLMRRLGYRYTGRGIYWGWVKDGDGSRTRESVTAAPKNNVHAARSRSGGNRGKAYRLPTCDPSQHPHIAQLITEFGPCRLEDPQGRLDQATLEDREGATVTT